MKLDYRFALPKFGRKPGIPKPFPFPQAKNTPKDVLVERKKKRRKVALAVDKRKKQLKKAGVKFRAKHFVLGKMKSTPNTNLTLL